MYPRDIITAGQVCVEIKKTSFTGRKARFLCANGFDYVVTSADVFFFR